MKSEFTPLFTFGFSSIQHPITPRQSTNHAALPIVPGNPLILEPSDGSSESAQLKDLDHYVGCLISCGLSGKALVAAKIDLYFVFLRAIRFQNVALVTNFLQGAVPENEDPFWKGMVTAATQAFFAPFRQLKANRMRTLADALGYSADDIQRIESYWNDHGLTLDRVRKDLEELKEEVIEPILRDMTLAAADSPEAMRVNLEKYESGSCSLLAERRERNDRTILGEMIVKVMAKAVAGCASSSRVEFSPAEQALLMTERVFFECRTPIMNVGAWISRSQEHRSKIRQLQMAQSPSLEEIFEYVVKGSEELCQKQVDKYLKANPRILGREDVDDRVKSTGSRTLAPTVLPVPGLQNIDLLPARLPIRYSEAVLNQYLPKKMAVNTRILNEGELLCGLLDHVAFQEPLKFRFKVIPNDPFEAKTEEAVSHCIEDFQEECIRFDRLLARETGYDIGEVEIASFWERIGSWTARQDVLLLIHNEGFVKPMHEFIERVKRGVEEERDLVEVINQAGELLNQKALAEPDPYLRFRYRLSVAALTELAHISVGNSGSFRFTAPMRAQIRLVASFAGFNQRFGGKLHPDPMLPEPELVDEKQLEQVEDPGSFFELGVRPAFEVAYSCLQTTLNEEAVILGEHLEDPTDFFLEEAGAEEIGPYGKAVVLALATRLEKEGAEAEELAVVTAAAWAIYLAGINTEPGDYEERLEEVRGLILSTDNKVLRNKGMEADTTLFELFSVYPGSVEDFWSTSGCDRHLEIDFELSRMVSKLYWRVKSGESIEEASRLLWADFEDRLSSDEANFVVEKFGIFCHLVEKVIGNKPLHSWEEKVIEQEPALLTLSSEELEEKPYYRLLNPTADVRALLSHYHQQRHWVYAKAGKAEVEPQE